MKLNNIILLSMLIFTLIGCGGTDTNLKPNDNQQENYNNTFGSQDIAGIWYVYDVQDDYTNRKQPSEKFELDNTGQLYDIAINGIPKKQVSTYKLISNQELKIFKQSGTVTAQYISADQEDNNCFYTENTFHDKSASKLWCKKAETDIVRTVKFEDFLYPFDTLITGIRTIQNIHRYEDKGQGIRYTGFYEKAFSKYTSSNETSIEENRNGNKYQTDKINTDKIFSFDSDNNSKREYPKQVALEDTFPSDRLDLTCKVEDIMQGIDLSKLLNSSIIQNFESHAGSNYYNPSNSFTYTNNVLHIHCNTSSGTTLDEYYVDALGNVLTISSLQDGSSKYEILDKLSIRH